MKEIASYKLKELIKCNQAPTNVIYKNNLYKLNEDKSDYENFSTNSLLYVLDKDNVSDLELVIKIQDEWENIREISNEEIHKLDTRNLLKLIILNQRKIIQNQKYLKERLEKEII